tara:strand:- start:5192 stop:5383 length:192 start_codon:yes stop_codon:yes gene_type:complete
MTRIDTKNSKPGTPEELAEATTRHAFEEADADHNGTLSYEEFKKWYVVFERISSLSITQTRIE